jgi:hypothetical protein
MALLMPVSCSMKGGTQAPLFIRLWKRPTMRPSCTSTAAISVARAPWAGDDAGGFEVDDGQQQQVGLDQLVCRHAGGQGAGVEAQQGGAASTHIERGGGAEGGGGRRGAEVRVRSQGQGHGSCLVHAQEGGRGSGDDSEFLHGESLFAGAATE